MNIMVVRKHFQDVIAYFLYYIMYLYYVTNSYKTTVYFDNTTYRTK